MAAVLQSLRCGVRRAARGGVTRAPRAACLIDLFISRSSTDYRRAPLDLLAILSLVFFVEYFP